MPRPYGSDPSVARASAMQIGLDQQLRPAAEAYPVNLQVLHHPLNVVARFRERNALDPVNGIYLGSPRVPVLGDPLLHAPAPRVIADEGEDVGSAIVLDELTQLGGAQLHVVGLIAQQPP